jgi:hypothetical protein
VTDSDDLLATDDDIKLVANEIDRCLTEAGEALHSVPGGAGAAHNGSRHVRAQHYLLRVQLLDRLGVRKAAVYLRQELLDAISAQRADGDSVTLQAMGFTGRPVITTTPDATWIWDNITDLYNQYAQIDTNLYARSVTAHHAKHFSMPTTWEV